MNWFIYINKIHRLHNIWLIFRHLDISIAIRNNYDSFSSINYIIHSIYSMHVIHSIFRYYLQETKVLVIKYANTEQWAIYINHKSRYDNNTYNE